MRELHSSGNTELGDEFINIKKLCEDKEIYAKLYRAMNNWVRARINNAVPTSEALKDMISECNSEFCKDDATFYNPLAIWNE